MVDQTKSGKKWQLLSKIEVTDNQEFVVILEDTGGKVSADGIRFKKTAETVNNGDERQLYFAHSDHLNTPTKLTNTNGKIVWQAQYSPFGLGQINGDVDADGTAVTFNIRFAGQYFDVESGLHYNWHRYYDPAIGRYISSDPIGLAGGINTYGYAYQNPVMYVDPTGEVGIFGALIGGGLDLAIQLYNNGGNLDCVSWIEVGAAGAMGAVGGAWTKGLFKHAKSGKSWFNLSQKWENVSPRVRNAQKVPKSNDLHHWAIARNGKVGKYVADSIKNHPLNLHSIPRNVHQNIHGSGLTPYNAFGRWSHGTPRWAKAGQGSIASGVGSDLATAGECGCGN